jgi:hypothetical protein
MKEIDWTEDWEEENDMNVTRYNISYSNIVELYRISKKLIQMGYDVYDIGGISRCYEMSFVTGRIESRGNKLVYIDTGRPVNGSKSSTKSWIEISDDKVRFVARGLRDDCLFTFADEVRRNNPVPVVFATSCVDISYEEFMVL